MRSKLGKMSEKEKAQVNHQEVVDMVSELQKSINARLDSIDTKLKPMYEIYSTSTTLAKVTLSITKFIIKLSALVTAIGIIYLAIKRVFTGHL